MLNLKEMEEKSAYLEVSIQPSASQNKIVAYENNILKLKIAAPPVEGKANRKVIEFLSSMLGIKKTSIFVKSGLTSKHKILVISGISSDEIKQRLNAINDN